MPTLRSGGAVPLGDVYAFISSLYYRGKRSYGRAFGHRPGGGPATLVVTPSRGLVPDDEPVTLEDLRELAAGEVDPSDPGYLQPLLRTARELRRDLAPEHPVVLLGSIASDKYVEPLLEVFGERLLFPRTFVGRGDMSRGGLMLRRVESGEELEYVPAIDADRTGQRPPRLDG